jgi:hypothetical protein
MIIKSIAVCAPLAPACNAGSFTDGRDFHGAYPLSVLKRFHCGAEDATVKCVVGGIPVRNARNQEVSVRVLGEIEPLVNLLPAATTL